LQRLQTIEDEERTFLAHELGPPPACFVPALRTARPRRVTEKVRASFKNIGRRATCSRVP
jgi:hypothetical protein